jgi:uncharacterized protein (TIGR02453 family)
MLDQDVFNFLNQLKLNNNRDWFKKNKHLHDHSKKIVTNYAEELFQELKADNQLDRVKVFRIYRDVRFSKNKTPYKTHFGIGFHRTKPKYRGGYYLHLEPGNSFIATGFWKPEKEDLLRIRKEIEADHSYFKNVVQHPVLNKKWGTLKGDTLKTAPKGFEKDHPGIEHLRFKQFIFMKKINDQQIVKANFNDWIKEQFKAAKPFVNFMGEILTTDLNGESII